MNEPLKDGNATLIGYRDGRVDIVDWSGGPNPGPGVAWARQSLAPIVWNGQLNPDAEHQSGQPPVGLHAGRCHSSLAHRRWHRRPGQPHLRRR